MYFSITSYTTVGYGDVVLPASWRLLGPIEGAVGILMFGWSTAILVMALTRIYASQLRSLFASSTAGTRQFPQSMINWQAPAQQRGLTFP